MILKCGSMRAGYLYKITKRSDLKIIAEPVENKIKVRKGFSSDCVVSIFEMKNSFVLLPMVLRRLLVY